TSTRYRSTASKNRTHLDSPTHQGFSTRRRAEHRQPRGSTIRRLSGRLEGMPPVQTWEAREITVRGDPVGSAFNRQGRQVRIRDEIASGLGLTAQAGEDAPVTPSRRHTHHAGLIQEKLGETQRLTDRAGLGEDPRVSGDPYHR